MKNTVITIGTFDGIHKGHQTILNKVVKIAKEKNLKSIVISFEKPVKEVSGLITDTKEKIDILSSFDIDEILLFPVNKKIISITAEDFFKNILVKKLNVSHIVAGYDCTFGKDRQGTVKWLKENVKKYGIALTVVKPVKIDNKIVSSSAIRQFLLKNDVESASKMLNRNFSFSGTHITGNRIGRTLGFPTINIKTDKNKLLPHGVFACTVVDKNFNTFYGVLNIGIRPSVKIKEHNLSVEIHLLNFSGVWKSKQVKVYINKFIRPEQKFKNLQELKTAIKNDVETCRKFCRRLKIQN